MTPQSSVGPRPRKPLRLWPGVALGVLILALRYLVPAVGNRVLEADTALTVALVGFLGAILAAILVLAWWLLFSRAAWVDRLLALGLVAIGFLAGPLVQDRSITTGAMGMLYPILVIPIVGLAFVGMGRPDAAASRRPATRDDGRGDPAGLRVGRPDPHRRVHRRHEPRLRLALDADAGGAPAGGGEPEPAAAPPVAPAPIPAPASSPTAAAAPPTPTPAPTAAAACRDGRSGGPRPGRRPGPRPCRDAPTRMARLPRT